MDLVSFENTYIQDRNSLRETDPDVFGCITIDGFPADEDGEGKVVCQVWLTMYKDFVVSWNDNGYRMNQAVLDLIEDSKSRLLDMWRKERETEAALCVMTVYPCVEFADGTAVICKYEGEHTGDLSNRLPMDACRVAAEYYAQQGLRPVKTYPVNQAAYEAFISKRPAGDRMILEWSEQGAKLTPSPKPEQTYVAVIRASAVRDAQYAIKANAELLDDDSWQNMPDAELYLGMYTGTDEDELRLTAAQYAGTDVGNIRLIPTGKPVP